MCNFFSEKNVSQYLHDPNLIEIWISWDSQRVLIGGPHDQNYSRKGKCLLWSSDCIRKKKRENLMWMGERAHVTSYWCVHHLEGELLTLYFNIFCGHIILIKHFKKTWNPALFRSSSARASVRLLARHRPFPITTLFGPTILFKESKISYGKTIIILLMVLVRLNCWRCPRLHMKETQKW